jgi:arylsulfatase A-like enzyme
MTRWCVMPILGALFSGCGEPASEPARTMQVERVVRDFLAEPGTWETVRAHPEGAPMVEVLCPSYFRKTDGVDMPALVVPPSGEVRLMFPDDARGASDPAPLRLVARAGVDQLAFKRLGDKTPKAHFAFEVRAGERVLVRTVIELEKSRNKENAWVDLGGPDGIDVAGLSEVSLRTEALRTDGSPIELGFPVLAGFGDLRLVRRGPRARTRSSPAQPNVVLVVMDTLRADRLSTYGFERPTSPHLTALAGRGILFENCYSPASWTWPATASILTGLTTMEHGLVGERSSYLFEQSDTFAERLQLAGFTTAAWSGNPIVGPRRNFDQGFERFDAAEAGDFRETAVFFEDVRAFLRREQGTRFFLYLHLVDPHVPHEPLEEGARLLARDVPPEFRAKCSDVLWRATENGEGVRPGGEVALDGIASAEEREWTAELYDASVWSGDHWLGELLAELAALGLDDETLVAFTSDHGEELFERGFFGHGQSLKQELVRVPLVLAGPGVPAAKRNRCLVSTHMLAPLLARLAGVDFGDGEAALRVLAQPECEEDFLLFTTTRGWWKGRKARLVGLTDGKWKLNVALDGAPWGATDPAPDGDLELYDLERDPLEREDLSASRPEVAARLRALLLERLTALEARRIGTDVPAGEATLQMLEQLGYTGADEDPEEEEEDEDH